MSRSVTSTNAAAPARAGRREWLGLGAIALPCVLYAMDLTVLNLALPRLSEALAPTSTQLLWLVDVYGFLVAGFLVTMGNLGDRIGRRRLLLWGAAAFGGASILAAFASSAAMLIVARAVLGVAGATLAPSTLSLIRTMFVDPRQRTAAIGMWATSFSVGGAIGPVLGGVTLQHLPWGFVFLLGVPVMIALLLVGPWLLPECRDPDARPLDLVSVALSLGAVLATIYGVKRWAHDGSGVVPLVAIVGGVAIGVLFVRRQRTLPTPLVDLALFRGRAFNVSLATFTLTTAVVFGSYVFVGQYLQLVLGLDPMRAGLWTLPGSLGVIAGSLLAPAIVRRVQPAWVIGGGLALATAGFCTLTQVRTFGLAGVVVGTVLTYVGLGPVFTLGTDLIVGAAPVERAGAAAALSETSSELGGAVGIALLGSVGAAIYRRGMTMPLADGLPEAAGRAARDTIGGATAAAATLPEHAAHALLSAARAAFTDALIGVTSLCAAVAAATAVMAVTVLRRRSPSVRSAATGPG